MLKFAWITVLSLMGLIVGGLATIAEAQTRPDVKLVLQITIDGLRADLIQRYEKGFGKDGFRYLLRKSVHYTDAHYQYANTETIVGHTTLATGTFPSRHGMVGNVWFDREAGELAYNIEDPDSPVLPTRKSESKGEQVDPAQKKSRTQGRSPRVILVPTIGDVMNAYYSGRSKVFGVSGKDRAAVSMAGKTAWRSGFQPIRGISSPVPTTTTVTRSGCANGTVSAKRMHMPVKHGHC